MGNVPKDIVYNPKITGLLIVDLYEKGTKETLLR